MTETTSRASRRTRTIAVTAAAATLAATAVAASGAWAVAATTHPMAAAGQGFASDWTAAGSAAATDRRPWPDSHHGTGATGHHNGTGSHRWPGTHTGSGFGGQHNGTGSHRWPGMPGGMGGGMNGGMGYGNGSQGWPGGMMGGGGSGAVGVSCTVPAVTGTQVRYVAMDMGSMMGGSMMRLMPMWTRVPAGQVTITLANRGTMPHELLVFPLADGQVAGQRTVGSNHRISETGMLGEVEPVCDQGQDVDGIAVGNVGRVRLDLRPGRYEIVCNLPGHYRNGMFATLIVT